MTSVNEIRSDFLDFFARNGHEVVPSGPLVPRNDPTLMFTNAGMVQFKNVFTGVEKRPYIRATHGAEMRARRRQAQRPRQCRLYGAPPHLLRDARQFLLRRLFQADAIELAWNADHASEFGLPKDRLLVTVYHDDDEAFDLWKKIAGLPESRIIRIATSRQFLGDGRHRPLRPLLGDLLRPGRQGPRRAARQRRTRTATGSWRFWNLVFMQFEQLGRRRARRTCRAPRSTPAWGSSASPPCCRACTSTTTST